MRHATLTRWFLIVVLAGLGACGDAGEEGAATGPAGRIVVVTHGQSSDPNWSVVKNGVDQAARDLGLRAEYQAPESFDMVAMAQLIDAAVASGPDGLVVSLPDADALGPAVRAAVQAGIPVISINSGGDVARGLGVLTHVGQAEYEAGFGGGQRLAGAGVKNARCVNMEVGNTSLDQRCQGFADALAKAGAASRVLAVELADPTETQQRIQAALSADPSIDALLTLGPTSAMPALQALRAEDKLATVRLATFDLSPEVLEAVEAGEILFAIDQQMYLQGYLPVMLLGLYHRNLNAIDNEIVKTGPSYVTSKDASRILDLVGQGTR